MKAPADLRLTGTSPVIDRAGTSPAAMDLAASMAPQDGDWPDGHRVT